jgi:hypothetical protein
LILSPYIISQIYKHPSYLDKLLYYEFFFKAVLVTGVRQVRQNDHVQTFDSGRKQNL